MFLKNYVFKEAPKNWHHFVKGLMGSSIKKEVFAHKCKNMINLNKELVDKAKNNIRLKELSGGKMIFSKKTIKYYNL